MTPQGNGRVGGQVDRITRLEIREWFGDGVGRTLDEMTYMVGDKIPNEVAARAVLDMPRVASLSLTERLYKGKRKLLQACFSSMIGSGFARRYREGGRDLWAVKNRPRVFRITERLPASVYDAPASTDSGITRSMVLQLIADNPGITDDKLVARLDKCWKIDNVISSYRKELLRTASSHGRPASAGSLIKPGEETQRAKRCMLSRIVRAFVKEGRIRVTTTYRVV